MGRTEENVKTSPGRSAPIALLAAGMLLLLMVGCRSSPEEGYPDILGWLPEESSLLMRLQVPGNEELADLILAGTGVNPVELEQVRKRASLVVAGIEADRESPALHLVTVGNWPRGLMGSALGKEWKKVSRHRWEGPGGIEIALPGPQTLVLSTSRTDTVLERAESGERRTFSGADTSGLSDLGPISLPDMEVWILDPLAFAETSPLMSAMAGAAGTVKMISLSLKRLTTGDYDLTMRAEPSEERYSRGLALALRLGLTARFGMSPLEEERNLMRSLSVVLQDGAVEVSVPSVSLRVIGNFLDELGLSGIAADEIGTGGDPGRTEVDS